MNTGMVTLSVPTLPRICHSPGLSPTPRLSANMPTAHVIPMVVSQPAKKRVKDSYHHGIIIIKHHIKHSVFPFDGYHSDIHIFHLASPLRPGFAVSVPNDGSAQAAHCHCYGKRPVGGLSFRVISKLVVSQGGHMWEVPKS